MSEPEERQLSLLRTRLPRDFRRRVEILLEGDVLAAVSPAWHDAVIILEEGEIEVECSDGNRIGFQSGAILFFDGLDATSLRNSGARPAVLVSVTRRPTA